MAKKPAAEPPPNIKEFNEVTAVILAECYKLHPKPADVQVTRIAQIFDVSPSDVMPSGETFQDVCVHTIAWLTREDFIRQTTIMASTQPPLCNLTARSLGGMRAVGPILTAVSDQASSETGKHKLAELAGDFFGAFTVSAVKTLAGS